MDIYHRQIYLFILKAFYLFIFCWGQFCDTQSPLAPGAQTGNPIQQQSGLSEALRDIRLDQGPVTSSSSHGGAASIAAAKKGKSPGDHHGHRHHGKDDLAGPTSHELWARKQPAAAITVEDTSVVPGGATATALTTSAGASSQTQVVAPPTNRADHVHYPSLKKLKETVTHAQLRATFYPKFENEKSDQEVRSRIIEVVSAGQGVLEVTLKHSGSLFLYSGDNGGAYAKNSYGNLYTAVGVFVLGRTLQEAWGSHAAQKQKEFNAHLQEHHICIGMELVTAVLGDHGQRPLHDYVVVTAVTKLKGRPLFYSTPDVVAFCHKWRLPTNHYWLFSTRNSVSTFFAAYDALCEEGLASTVTKSLTEIADTSLPATKRHEDIQGEILEGLVARVVAANSITCLQHTLHQFPRPSWSEALSHSGHGLREIFSANRESEKKQVEALLQAVGPAMCSNLADWLEDEVSEVDLAKKPGAPPMLESFLHSTPADLGTLKLQEMVRVVHKAKLPVRFKCRMNLLQQTDMAHNNVLSHFKMTVHVLSDSAFRRYQKEMSKHAGLWPLYRGFFVDISIYNATAVAPSLIEERASLVDKNEMETGDDVMADGSENLMLKLKFLPYKLRTFLIRNGLAILFSKGFPAYKDYYMRQMKIWGTSTEKQRELSQLLSEWATYITKRMKGKKLSSDTYLTETEPFLKQFALRSAKNQQLVGVAGSHINVEEFLADVAGQQNINADNDDGDLGLPEEHVSTEIEISSHAPQAPKAQGMLVFFPGIPGCAKSALCKELLAAPDSLSNKLPMHSLMGDLVKGKYWQKLKSEREKQPARISLADKNAPNDEVWQQIQSMCESTHAVGVPVVPDSEGATSNPYSRDDLAIFLFRVLQRTDHPGHLDKNSPNPGFVLLTFYNLHEGKDRKEFENELLNRFGHLVKMPLLKPDRAPMPSAILETLEEGLQLYRRHTNKHKRLESLQGSFTKEWSTWEKSLKDVLFAHANYLNDVQVPFKEVVSTVQQQLQAIANGNFRMHIPVEPEERSFRTFTFVAIALQPNQVLDALKEITAKSPEIGKILADVNLKDSLGRAHVTLAHKRVHGVAAVAAFGALRGCQTSVELTAVLFSEKLCALEVRLGDQTIRSHNTWPHVTVWTEPGVAAKEANLLPIMVSEDQAKRVEFKPISLTGVINFF
ncbi:unnamed protein product [Sphagnum troendelagicum]|uniref:tRNA ligase phosphodiesterase domain-containing protein n=1 Tax=Sphagnum troendelagicum TaxID=128251 RepID=A0ABP0UAD8_9BRYO